MKKIAVINHKGGVGKTTTAVCLAGALAEAGRRVLVVDLDLQASASAWLGVPDDGAGLLEALVSGRGFGTLVTEASKGPNGVAIVPSGYKLAGFHQATAGEAGAEYLLRDALETLTAEDWDFVLVDCPPTLDRLSVNALAAADAALIPVEAKFLSLEPLARLFQLIEQVKGRLNETLEVCGLVGCKMDSRKNHPQEVVDRLRERFGELVCQTVIRETVKLSEAPGFGQPVTEYDPEGIGSEDYRALAVEFEERMKEQDKQEAESVYG